GIPDVKVFPLIWTLGVNPQPLQSENVIENNCGSIPSPPAAITVEEDTGENVILGRSTEI
ncbi:hypothetical protein NL447_26955, partial [Klebsiella pneumoniae]|nr:hypothetical protein [Klebsiella pneumoniae]